MTSVSRKPTIGMKSGGPAMRGRGVQVPPQGGEDGYDQCWYVVAESKEVRPGEVIGKDFLGGRVIVWRGENGKVVVQSAYCRHLGADISVGGKVVGNSVRCPFHYWTFDQSGACDHIPCTNEIPRDAAQYSFAVVERFGLIWAFNGDESLYEVPEFVQPDEELDYLANSTIDCRLDHGLQMVNAFDFQHFAAVHSIQVVSEPTHEWFQYGMQQRGLAFQDTNRFQNTSIKVNVRLFGTNCLVLEGDMDGYPINFLVTSSPTKPGWTRDYTVISAPKGADEQTMRTLLTTGERWFHGLIVDDDQHIMNNVSWRMDRLVPMDKNIGQFVTYLKSYPRALPSRPYIEK